MKCPTCAIDLVMSERSGIEIDYCPTCRGVWLDRGELDKIIERSQPVRAEAPQAVPQGQFQPQPVRTVEVQREAYRGGMTTMATTTTITATPGSTSASRFSRSCSTERSPQSRGDAWLSASLRRRSR